MGEFKRYKKDRWEAYKKSVKEEMDDTNNIQMNELDNTMEKISKSMDYIDSAGNGDFILKIIREHFVELLERIIPERIEYLCCECGCGCCICKQIDIHNKLIDKINSNI